MSEDYSEFRPGDRHPSNRIPLTVMGISYSNVQRGAYAVLLSEVNGPYRIPIIVGTAEAQSIAFALEGVTPPRPLTHDLFTSFVHACNMELVEVFIYRFDDGIFSSELTFAGQDGKIVTLDARTSDAIGLAVRTGAPIFSTPRIVRETGFILDVINTALQQADEDTDMETASDDNMPTYNDDGPNLYNMPLDELEQLMKQHIANEEYEQAAVIKRIIESRKK